MNQRQLSDRIGNVEEELIHQAAKTPDYAARRRKSSLRRLVSLAAVIALMAISFTTGALAFSRETIVETPAEQETLELTKLGLTLILPQSWKGRYELIEWEGQYVVVCPEVREAALAQARAEWAGGEMEWPEELDRNPFSGGMLFYIFGIPEALTPEQLPDSDWGSFAEFTETRYLLATAERTYLLCHASDVQFTEETRALYERLEQSVKDIRIVVDHVL
ncbi:MAG: hypothetical protein OSJ58_02235 [Dysosmobacter sp.]|nr:hypothetical protein [Dysosmobacter sp.]